jgi:peptide/nickel transport system ATP-binding protein
VTAAPILEVNDLRAYYVTSVFGIAREVRAVDDVSLAIERNEIYGLAGESSCGKSTLIRTIAGAIRPPLRVLSGEIAFSFAGRRLAMQTATQAELSAIRWKHLSYIMQGSMSVLNPVRRVRHSFVDFAYRHVGGSKAAFLDGVRSHLRRLDLAADVLDAFPHELSGGMRQRIAIALATICRPDFIIADEPTTALDVVVQKSVLVLIRAIQQELGSSLLFVTHDLSVHANLSDRLGVMYAGRLVEEAATAELFRQPLHPYTTHLIRSLPRIGDVTAKPGLEGTPPNLADPPPGCRFHPRCPIAMAVCRQQVPPMHTVAGGHRVACFAVGASQ